MVSSDNNAYRVVVVAVRTGRKGNPCMCATMSTSDELRYIIPPSKPGWVAFLYVYRNWCSELFIFGDLLFALNFLSFLILDNLMTSILKQRSFWAYLLIIYT